MRLLIDGHGLDWEQAWSITRQTFCYTNHTLLPEALETWPIGMLEHVLPRHLEIIYLINHGHLQQVRFRFPGEVDVLRRMSLVDEGTQRIRMAHLAIVGSSRVNGVAALHTRLLREQVFPEFDEMYPGKFVNVTNGVTQRRWLLQCNPALSSLITGAIGDAWTTELNALSALEPLAEDAAFRERFNAIKIANKARLAAHLHRETASRSIPPACSTCRSSAFMNTSASFSTCCTSFTATCRSARARWTIRHRARSSLGARPRRATIWPS